MLGLVKRSSVQLRPANRAAMAAARPVSKPVGRVALRAVAEAKAETKKKKKEEEEDDFEDAPEVAVSTSQVQSFLSTLCGDTNIAQIELKMGGFNMKVRRSIEGAAAAAAPAPAAAAAAPAAVLAAPAPVAVLTADAAGFSDESVDEALVYVASPKVGLFRRGKYAANKRVGKDNLVSDGDTVKKGQTLAYVEQLGTFVEVKAPQAGEITRFKVDEGEPVEYGQVVVELAPFFGGHIIGDSKHA